MKLSKYRFTMEAVEKISMPVYKGSTFHGGFGHALMQISPTWYRYFFEPGAERKGDWPKPFVLLPPLDQKQSYLPDQQFCCELTLFGDATKHYSIAQAAIEYLGLKLGLGANQGIYRIISIDQASPVPSRVMSSFTSANDIISTRIKQLSPTNIPILFPTRLRLKRDNKIHRQPPPFDLLFERLVGRIKTLDKAFGSNEFETNSQYKELIEKARTIKIYEENLSWKDWSRKSGRQDRFMNFGGMVGTVTYFGDLEQFLPYLALGEWLHVGNKSSFGLGKYILGSKEISNV